MALLPDDNPPQPDVTCFVVDTVAFLYVYVAWGATYLGVHCGLESIPPFLLAGSRESVAPWTVVRPSMRLDSKRYIENYQYMDIEKFALAFKALAHPHRLAIFLRLANCCEKHDCDADACSRLCVGELGKGLGIGQPTVSHHLKELARAGLISTRRCGQNTECWVAETTLDEFSHFFLQAKVVKSSKRK